MLNLTVFLFFVLFFKNQLLVYIVKFWQITETPLKFGSIIIILQNSVVLEIVNLTPTFRWIEIACAVALIGCDLKINNS